MTASPLPLASDRAFGSRAGFLVWGTPDVGPRSRLLARELGIDDLRFCSAALGRGPRTVALRYAIQTIWTLRWLMRSRRRAIFVQHPPSIAAWVVALYARLSAAAYVIDAHSATFQFERWKRPHAVHRWLMRHAAAVLVTDPFWADRVTELGGRPLVVPDIPVDPPPARPVARPAGFTVAVVNTWAADEPIDAVIGAARRDPETSFLVTGRIDVARRRFPVPPANVLFTGFLPDETYHGLLASADAVMCLTTRDHTMQRGACEALLHARPVITSDHALLRTHFGKAGVFVSATPQSIAQGVREMRAGHPAFVTAARALGAARRAEWLERRALLRELIGGPDAEQERQPTGGVRGGGGEP